jgi:hypothetical protein
MQYLPTKYCIKTIFYIIYTHSGQYEYSRTSDKFIPYQIGMTLSGIKLRLVVFMDLDFSCDIDGHPEIRAGVSPKIGVKDQSGPGTDAVLHIRDVPRIQ